MGVIFPSLIPISEQKQILCKIVVSCQLGFLGAAGLSIGDRRARLQNAPLLVQADSEVEPGDRFAGSI